MRNRLWLGIPLALLAVAGFGQDYKIITLAGGGVPQNVPAATASLGGPIAVATDGAGNVYMTLRPYSAVVRMDPSGLLTLVAGNGTPGYSGDNGPATSAQLNNPWGIAVDNAGNLYIADSGNNRVRKVSNGVITTIAGNNPAVQLSNPTGVAVDSAGNVFIADANNHIIRKVSGAVTTTVAGTGSPGGGGTLSGSPLGVALNTPTGVAVDGAGNLYIADVGNSYIRKVSGGSLTTLFQVGGGYGLAADAAGNLWVSAFNNNVVVKVPASGSFSIVAGNQTDGYSGDGGAATSAALSGPTGVALDAAGNLYIADYYNTVVRKVTNGIISTVAGSTAGAVGDGGSATNALLFSPQDSVSDGQGNLYIADTLHNRIRKVTNGIITTVAGTGQAGFGGDGGPATSALLSSPAGLALDAAGNLFVSDTNNNVIRKISGGVITTVVGTPTGGSFADNVAATGAALNSPQGIAVDAGGNIFIADSGTQRVRKVSNGQITTIAGIGGAAGYNGDGGQATAAALNNPSDVKVDAAGNVYIADFNNHRVRMISGGIISTIAGNGSAGYGGDGGPATGAQLNGPAAIAVDPGGEILIADTRNNVIRQVFRGGISTLAGNGVAGYGGDNRSAATSSLNSPVSVSLDKAGRIYITDSGNNLIRGLNIYCNYSFSPSSLTVSAAGGTAKVTVQTDTGCTWTVSNLPDWVTYSGPAIVTGTATATFSVTPHPGDARSATISIAGLPVTITQAACAYSFSPAGQVFSASGGSATVNIATSPGCSWTVAPGAPWIGLTSPASGTGSGSITFTVAPDSAGRTAAITLGSASFTVQQLSAAAPGLFVGSMPHIAAQSVWTTTFTVVNTTSAASLTRLSLLGSDLIPNGNGSPLALSLDLPQAPASTLVGAAVERTLPPNASLIVKTSERPDLPVATGSVLVNANGSMSGFAIFRRVPDSQEAVVPLETRDASSYVLYFDNTNGLSLGVAVANISVQAGTVGVIVRDDTGAQIATGSIPLPANGQTSFLLTDSKWFPGTAGKRGTIEFDTPAGGRISVLGIRNSPPLTSITTVPPLAAVDANGGNFAYLASGGGWKTSIVLMNTGTKAGAAHLKFFDTAGAPLSLPVSYPQTGGNAAPVTAVDQSLAPGATLLVETGALTGPLLTGSAQFTTDGNISGFVIFRNLVNNQEAVVPIESRKASAYLLAFDNTAGTFTGVAMSSTSTKTQPVSVGVVIRDDTGTQISADTIQLSANGLRAFTLAFDKYPETAGLRGTIEFTPPAGEQISVLGIRQPLAGTLTTLPVLVR